MERGFWRYAVACGLWLVSSVAGAQTVAPGVNNVLGERQQRIGDNHYKFFGAVELEAGDTKIYADELELLSDEHRAIATGNVVFQQGPNRIAAERADFNTETRLGTFYNAFGIAAVRPPRPGPPRPGAAPVPQVPGQDTNVYFFGDTVEKLGPKKYKITNGGFTACVQPTPRWDLHADTVVLNIDRYTLLKQAVFTVKGVPMLYLPVMYYPTKREDRATGFLLPTYGSSTLRGQAIHNAFFWVLGRSQDATILYDWFSKTGQGVGSEYRYNYGAGSNGNLNAYFLDEHGASYELSDGSTNVSSARRSYNLRGTANQVLPANIRARGGISYFSDIAANQTSNVNINDATRSQRYFGGNLIGPWRMVTLNATFDHREYFSDENHSTISGSWPRVNLARNERPLGGSPLYASVGTEFVRLLNESKSTFGELTTEVDNGLTRVDVFPQIRYPFKRWLFLTANTSAGWRETYYTRSFAPGTSTVVDGGLNRRYFTVQTQIVGPVFTRIFDTPSSGYAEKFKHSIEPYVNIQRISSIDNYALVPKLDSVDFAVGGTQFNYGLHNRFYAKRRFAPGAPSQAREILAVEVSQSYYTDQRASLCDPRYNSSCGSFGTSQQLQNNFSPLALNVRAIPSVDFNASVRAEFDSRYRSLRTISANGTYSWMNRILTTAGWSKQGFIPQLQGFNDPNGLYQSLTGSTTVRTRDNHFGGLYALNYDFLRDFMVQQRVTFYYNAQCCGLALEYQTYNFGNSGFAPIPADHRFFLSFTLAGLGNFSPFNGALGGVPR